MSAPWTPTDFPAAAALACFTALSTPSVTKRTVEPGRVKQGPREGAKSPHHDTVKNEFLSTAEYCGTCHNDDKLAQNYRIGTKEIGKRVRAALDQVGLLVPPPGDTLEDPDRPVDPVHDALRAHLGQRGASFWPDLVQAVGTVEGVRRVAARETPAGYAGGRAAAATPPAYRPNRPTPNRCLPRLPPASRAAAP